MEIWNGAPQSAFRLLELLKYAAKKERNRVPYVNMINVFAFSNMYINY